MLVGIVAMLSICIMTNLAIPPADGKPHPVVRLVAVSGILIVVALSCSLIGFTINAFGILGSNATDLEETPAAISTHIKAEHPN